MGKNTKIEWADNSHNFWTGCLKVSQGCKFCYMYRLAARYGKDGSVIYRANDDKFNEPLKWKKPATVFTCSMSDFFIKEADEWRADAWKIIKATPHLTWIILTKRIKRVKQCLPPDWGKGYPNVWLGVSVENQKTADHRIPMLYEIPAAIRFLSVEPILGPIDLSPFLSVHIPPPVDKWVLPIHWVIIGGESGNDNGDYIHRPAELDWFRDIIAACREFETPVFVKQLGTHQYHKLKLTDRMGGDFEDANFPPVLKIRELPKTDF